MCERMPRYRTWLTRTWFFASYTLNQCTDVTDPSPRSSSVELLESHIAGMPASTQMYLLPPTPTGAGHAKGIG